MYGDSQPNNYYTDTSLPSMPSLSHVTPPGRIVLIADGCTPMIASQGPPTLTHPDSAVYFGRVENVRENIASELIRSVKSTFGRFEYEYPIQWDTSVSPEQSTVSQSSFYHTFVSFSVRNPLVDAIRNFRSIPVAPPHTQETVLDFLFVDNGGRLGVSYNTLVTCENHMSRANVLALPRQLVSRGFVENVVDLLALEEPVYPLYPQDLDSGLVLAVEQLSSHTVRKQYSNVFLDFPLHIVSFSPDLLHSMQNTVTKSGGAAQLVEVRFLNMGACSKDDRGGEFLGEVQHVPVNLRAFGKDLWELQRLIASKIGAVQLRAQFPLTSSTTDPDLWYLSVYEKLLEQPLGVIFVRLYYADIAQADAVSPESSKVVYHY